MKALRVCREKGMIRAWWRHRSLLDLTFRPGLALGLCQFSDDYDGHYTAHVHLGWPNIYLTLPWRVRRPVPMGEMMLSWGFSSVDDAVHFNWADKCKIVHLPWSWVCTGHEVQLANGSWAPFIGSWERDKGTDGRAEWTHPYTYKLRSGELQHREATISVQRWKRRRRWLKWTSLFERKPSEIAVEFSDEVGERSGSWKGGCIGCGYTMQPGETPLQALRRMERERKF